MAESFKREMFYGRMIKRVKSLLSAVIRKIRVISVLKRGNTDDADWADIHRLKKIDGRIILWKRFLI